MNRLGVTSQGPPLKQQTLRSSSAALSGLNFPLTQKIQNHIAGIALEDAEIDEAGIAEQSPGS